ncbi:MAG: hypothetical protein JWQ11_4094, partial [Rhizobacter sp.]|nr:hypothetical protein [Rhizobacter sp.]
MTRADKLMETMIMTITIPHRFKTLASSFAVTALAALALAACSTSPTGSTVVMTRPAPPAPDCKAWVGTDRDAEITGYLLPKKTG